MIAQFDIKKHKTNQICIQGLELHDGQYLVDYIPSFKNYTWEDTVTVNLLKLSCTGKIIDSVVINHSEELSDECVFEFKNDGIHEVVHLIVPTEQWHEKMQKNGQDVLNKLQDIVYYDGNQFITSKGSITAEELIDHLGDKSSIVNYSKLVFNDCHIKACFYKINKEALTKLRKCEVDKQEMLWRDILFMAVYSIQYALDLNQLHEAQNILENVMDSCDKLKDCGCNR